MKKMKRIISAVLTLLLLTGCGKKKDYFQVIFAAPYVSQEVVEAYAETIETEGEVVYSGFSFGSEDADPVTFAAGAMAMTAMMSAGEVDILVCDLENAARYARSELFLDLSTVLSREDLDTYSDRLLTFDMVDEAGEPTGEKTPPCGLDLSGNENIVGVLGSENCGIFIFCGTGDPATAGEIFQKIVNQ